MPPINRIAVTLPAEPNIQRIIELVQWAEENGITDFWFGDVPGGPDSLTQVAAIGRCTNSIRLGVAVTPVYTRSPSVLAATASVIEQLIPGRFVMGLGSSSQTIMSQWNGIPLDKPLTRVKETAQLVKIMLSGAKTDFQGETLTSRGYRQAPLENPPPVYVGCLRQKMIEMAAEVGDGVIFNLWPRGALPKMMEAVKRGAEKGGKNWEDIEVVGGRTMLCTDDKDFGRNLFRAAIAPYFATPVYNKFLSWAGYPEAADAIAEGWAEKNRKKIDIALTDHLIDDIAIIGNEDEVRARIQEDAEGGVHTHIIAPLAAASAKDRDRTLNAFTADKFQFK